MKKVLARLVIIWSIGKALLKRDAQSGHTNLKIPWYASSLLMIGSVGFHIKDGIIKWRIRRQFSPKKFTAQQKELIREMAGKVLAIQGYKKHGYFYVEDFADPIRFSDRVLGEMESRETDLTPDGYKFLENFYGWNQLATILYHLDSDFPSNSIPENEHWLKGSAQY